MQKKNGPEDADVKLILTHGAGAGIETEFMTHIATGIAKKAGIQVIRFEFPYMETMRKTGKRRAPNTAKVLMETFTQEIKKYNGQIFIGGKSMGGRIASMIGEKTTISGCICLGYPFHPPGKPEKLRTEHLQQIKKPILIIQGERDPFGTKTEIPQYTLSENICIKYLPDGEHSFKPRKKSGYTTEQNWDKAIEYAVAFINKYKRKEG